LKKSDYLTDAMKKNSTTFWKRSKNKVKQLKTKHMNLCKIMSLRKIDMLNQRSQN